MNTEPSNPASNTMGTKGVTPESNKSTPGAVPKSVIRLKLLVDVENSRVLFAEADKKLVDFLFGLIRMRVGSMVSLLGKKSMVGSIDNLYESVEELNNQYLLYPNRSRYELLQPRSMPRFTGHRIQPVLKSQGNIEKKKFFTCPDHDLVGSLVTGGKCPKCKQSFMREVEVIEPNAPIGNNIGKKKKRVGFVKEVVKYMITDDLEVTPLSVISGLDIIRKFDIKDISALEKRTIEVGIDESPNMMEPDSEISLKLLIDKDSNKVLYAECGKDFVDFLLSLLSMRMGTMIRLLEKQSMVGCIDKLYESVENLSGLYMLLPRKNRKALLDPCFVPRFRMKRLRLLPVLAQKRRKRKITPQERLRNRFLIAQAKSRENTLYTCSKCRQFVCRKSLFVCPWCDHSFDDRVRVIKPDSPSDLENVSGVVKALVTYMISDDLIVKPLSTLSCLTIAKQSNIKDITLLEETTRTIGFDEARKLMKAAFQSKSVLTDVFLGASVI